MKILRNKIKLKKEILNRKGIAFVPTMGALHHGHEKMIKFAEYNQTTIIGPNGPGFIIPGITKLGIIPGNYFKKGNTAIISRSGTLTYEIAWNMSMNALGQSIAIGLGRRRKTI